MIKAYDAYTMYLGIKMHFRSKNYDFVRYNGKVKSSYEKFQTRNDRYFFEKLARKYSGEDLQMLYVANFLEEPDIWIGSLFDEVAINRYYGLRRRVESMSYNFDQEIQSISNHKFSELISCKDGQHPKLLLMYMRKEISPETILILNEVFDLFKRWDKHLKNDILWEEIRKKCLRYGSFIDTIVKANRSNFVAILKKRLLDK